ncbi:hypothetical protein [Candidatus Uabimicrobium amorphum]|uniref:Uncharacterized protein n=1 Tax=Uabimicrobium amorphum TaxID=2596890 RepID=A0A5S9IM01_UABAM|nr:hypothetical protein [Candidatus Uabimicrobium amorphum]BBM83896.1 hypothetical protein UABAM_02251 [Candidatus Uabimicrobium amorphum]
MEFEDFSKKLKQQDLMTILILQFALTMGVILFSGVIGGMFFMMENEVVNDNVDVLNILSAMAGVLSFSAIMFFVMLPKLRYKEDTLRGIFESEDPVASFMTQFRTTRIVQMAVLEGAALLGLVACLLAIVFGIMAENSAYWANLIPAVIMVLISATNFPTKSHLYGHFKHLQDNYSLVKR